MTARRPARATGGSDMVASSVAARGVVADSAPVDRPRPLRIRLLERAAAIAPHLPLPGLVLAAELAGEIRYRLRPRTADQVRRNLARVCAWLVRTDLASPRIRRAAAEPAALERLVRSAFRHHARTYLELLVLTSMDPARRERMLTLTPSDLVTDAIRPDRAAILVGLHLGSIELQALTVSHRTGRSTLTTMEEVGDPDLQAWFERSRAAAGVRIVRLREARRELGAALARGEAVGLVADRDVTGGGMPVELFGAPARLPVGPALLAVESGAPVYVGAIRRTGRERYRGRLIALGTPTDGRLRDRVLALLHAEARTFERLIAPAPDQWWSVFFPIWPDLEASAGATPSRDAAPSGRAHPAEFTRA